MEQEQERKFDACSEPELSDLFFLLVNGDLDLAEQARIEEHLGGCSKCREGVKFFLDLQKVGRQRFGIK